MKKFLIFGVAVFSCMAIAFLCIVLTDYNYGKETTFYSHNGETVYFDGKGNCIDGDIECTYYIKKNQYYIRGDKVTREMTLVRDGVLVDFSESGLSLDTGVRSGNFDAKFEVGGEKYAVCGDGTFGFDYGKFVLKLGEYFFNDGVLAFRYDKDISFSPVIRSFYLYVGDSGEVYGVLLSNPELFFRR